MVASAQGWGTGKTAADMMTLWFEKGWWNCQN
jgi:hypothetical protein